MPKLTVKDLLTELDLSPADINALREYQAAANITLEGYFEGLVDREQYQLPAYTEAEQRALIADCKNILALVLADCTPQEYPRYEATAGSPGVSHPEFLHQRFDFDPKFGRMPQNMVYLAPDDLVMPNMAFYKDLFAKYGHEVAYKHAKAGSNLIVNLIHVLAVARRLNILHDTTLSSVRSITIMQALVAKGYSLKVHVISASKDTRRITLGNLPLQNRQIVDVPTDLEKTADVFKRMADCYTQLPLSDFYWVEMNAEGKPDFTKFAIYNGTSAGAVEVIEEASGAFAQFKLHVAAECREPNILPWINMWSIKAAPKLTPQYGGSAPPSRSASASPPGAPGKGVLTAYATSLMSALALDDAGELTLSGDGAEANAGDGAAKKVRTLSDYKP